MSAAESHVIGSLLLPSADAWPEVRDMLTADDFSGDFFRSAWQAIADMHDGEHPVDVATVAAELERRGGDAARGALAWLGEAARDVPSVANVRAYAGIVRTESRRRDAIEIAERLRLAVPTEGLDAVDIAVRGLLALRDDGESAAAPCLADLLADVMTEMGEEVAPGINTGLRDLDTALGGLMPGDLVIVGARPAMGKTAFALNLALNARMPVGFVSSEQPARQIAARVLARQSGVSLHRMRTRRLLDDDWPRLASAVKASSATQLHIADRSQPTLADVERQARAWRYHHGIRALFVDYVQHLRNPGYERRHEEVAAIVRGLKRIARDLDIPVIALSQVKRDVEQRSNKRPLIGDLLESGVIEQEADEILLLYRDEVYNAHTQSQGVCEVNIEKNRHGPTGMIELQWDGETLRFRDLVRRDQWSGAA